MAEGWKRFTSSGDEIGLCSCEANDVGNSKKKDCSVPARALGEVEGTAEEGRLGSV